MLTTIFIILLIISQLLCFYMIALLNAKIANFKNLEVRQDRLMREMEETISLYLVEIQEENDRLIRELKEVKQTNNVSNTIDSPLTPTREVQNRDFNEQEGSTEQVTTSFEQKVFTPNVVARNAYNKYRNPTNTNEQKTIDDNSIKLDGIEKSELNLEPKEEIPLSFEQQVIKLHKEGKSIEEIAKVMNKGKTEIELLLKFQA